MAKEKTKLKNLEIGKVDFVDVGANPDADIVLTKRQDPEEQPDSFWKGLIGYIRRHLPAEQGDGAEVIEKDGSRTFADKLSERSREKTRDEIWGVCYALHGSFVSILEDNDLDHAAKKTAMEQSASEFSQAVGDFIDRWSRGATANVLKQQGGLFAPKKESPEAMREVLDGGIGKAQGRSNEEPPARPEKGGVLEMEIDKSKMTPKDQAVFEELAKAYGWTEAPDTSTAGQSAALQTQIAQTPAVRAELMALRKARESYEERELLEVAKKYEAIGKKAEELVPVLKSLKASGGAAYDNYLAVLEEMAALQNASGMFSEIGKSGGHVPVGADEEDEAFAKARTKAAEIRKARPELTEEQAIDLAITESPEIAEALM